MFCPNCAAQNQDQTKYCRSCGADLKIVALALNGQLEIPSDVRGAEAGKLELTKQWLDQQSKGIDSVIQGSLLFIVSILMGAALAFFSGKNDWMIIWLIFCGWLAVWAASMVGTGLSSLIKSRITRRGIALMSEAAHDTAAGAAVDTRRLT